MMRKDGDDRLLYFTGLDYGEMRDVSQCAAPSKGRILGCSAEHIVAWTPAGVDVEL